MFESKYSKLLTALLIILIVAIVLLLGFLAFDYIQKYTVTKHASDFVDTFEGEFSSNQGENNTNIIEDLDENVVLDNSIITDVDINTSNTGMPTKKKYKGFTVAGTIKIPSINLEYPIIEEITTKALETAIVVLYPSGDNLNKLGNTVLIGHNYRNGLFFSNVKKLSNGDKIYITDYTGNTIVYEIYNMFEALQNDTSFYSRDTNGLAEITLSTCTDASNDQRIIVFAKQRGE